MRTVVLVLFCLALALGPADGHAAGGVALPAFTVQTLDGASLESRELTDRPLLLLLVAQDCADCERVLPGIERTWQRYHASGLRVLAVTTGSTADAADWKRERELSFDVATNGASARSALGASELPTWLLVDAQGMVRFRSTSADPLDPMLDLVSAELLGIDPEDCGTVLC